MVATSSSGRVQVSQLRDHGTTRVGTKGRMHELELFGYIGRQGQNGTRRTADRNMQQQIAFIVHRMGQLLLVVRRVAEVQGQPNGNARTLQATVSPVLDKSMQGIPRAATASKDGIFHVGMGRRLAQDNRLVPEIQ
jgi:hypothetical protein